MTSGKGPSHVVVDGSNIATEGRSLPSLAQLSEAVMSFMEEHPNTAITVVVDATFGHRIDKKEVKEFEEGISNNELVAPPAGAVGRGDAFVLAIAQKSNASILSNDSFQEFHADYEWLFDEGRLIGGKPVPHVGWVFVDRVPVRGPVSRKATGSKGGSRRGARKDDVESERRSGRKASDAASQPMPVPKTPPPGRSRKPAAPDVEAADGGTGGTAAQCSQGRRDRQRPDAVPRVRRAPPGRHERERNRRVVLVARCLHLDRRERRARLRAAAIDGRPRAAERSQGDEARRVGDRRRGELRPVAAQHRLRGARHGAGCHRSGP